MMIRGSSPAHSSITGVNADGNTTSDGTDSDQTLSDRDTVCQVGAKHP